MKDMEVSSPHRPLGPVVPSSTHPVWSGNGNGVPPSVSPARLSAGAGVVSGEEGYQFSPDTTSRVSQLLSRQSSLVVSTAKVGGAPDDSALRRQCSSPIGEECRICKDGSSSERLLRPCDCQGSMARVHVKCLTQWIDRRRQDNDLDPLSCEVCRATYRIVVREEFDMSMKKLCSCSAMGFYAEFATILVTLVAMVGLFYLFSSSKSQASVGTVAFFISMAMGLTVLGLGMLTLFKVSSRWRQANSVPVISPLSPRSPNVSRP